MKAKKKDELKIEFPDWKLDLPEWGLKIKWNLGLPRIDFNLPGWDININASAC